MSSWKFEEERVLQAVRGNLAVAHRLVDACISHGPCPLSTSDIKKARAVSGVAAVCLDESFEDG